MFPKGININDKIYMRNYPNTNNQRKCKLKCTGNQILNAFKFFLKSEIVTKSNTSRMLMVLNIQIIFKSNLALSFKRKTNFHTL